MSHLWKKFLLKYLIWGCVMTAMILISIRIASFLDEAEIFFYVFDFELIRFSLLCISTLSIGVTLRFILVKAWDELDDSMKEKWGKWWL